MQLYLRLAWRNIWRHRRRTVIIVLAMGLSLAMMMWYDGLMDGFNNAIAGNAVRVLGGNVQVHAAGYRAKVDSNPLLPLADDSAIVKAALAQPNVIAAAPPNDAPITNTLVAPSSCAASIAACRSGPRSL